MVRVSRVLPGSICDEMGVVAGTELLTVNGRALADFLDWEFLTADDELVIEARLPDGEEIVYEIERPEGEALGVELEPPTVRRCANRCEFCFIEGLPQGPSEVLYIRDDDYRLSFAYGNFATLSNVKERDIARILEYRLSPLYVSVHATPWEARKVLLNNPRVPNIVEQLTRLAEGGIQFHGQMVDRAGPQRRRGARGSRSRDLWNLGDAVLQRRGRAGRPDAVLAPLHGRVDGSARTPAASSTRSSAGRRRALAERGDRWVFGSDELYLLAGARRCPAPSTTATSRRSRTASARSPSLRERVRDGLDALPRLDGKRIGVVTGSRWRR